MSQTSRDQFRVLPRYQPLMRLLGIDAEAVFLHPDIKVWRKLTDRENCTIDGEMDGKPVRLHIKRYLTRSNGAADEVKGIELLRSAAIETVPLVAWGRVADGRSFVITDDLTDFKDSEQLVRAGMPFSLLIHSTANLAAKLHDAGLHHRDMYLCHFFSRVSGDRSCDVAVRLIDAARVARTNVFTRQRWIIKDLAQFWYSTTTIPEITDDQRDDWLKTYISTRKLAVTRLFNRAIQRKAAWIARHDEKLKRDQPTRNISIPK